MNELLKRVRLTVIIGILLCLFITDLSAQSRYALVIGNSNYEYLDGLKNAGNDARDLGRTLELMDFTVDVHFDLDREGLKDVISNFGSRARDFDILLFYYAGHGIEVSGKNYFVPTDAIASSISEVKRTCVNASAVSQYMKIARAETNIIIMDACRENPFTLLPENEASDGLALMDAPTGTIISFATAPGNVASDGEGKNGVYTSALIRHLPAFDLDIKEVFARVRNTVILKTENQQIPWESTSLTKEVVLRPKPELPMQINILEGDSVIFEGNGVLHASANLQGVSFYWYYEGRQLSNTPTIQVNKTGSYRVKGISKAGQIVLSDPIEVQIKSFVNPFPWIEEGFAVRLKPGEVLHGKSNVTGEFRWLKDGNVIDEGTELEVELPGRYAFQVETREGMVVTSEYINVKFTDR
jgi:hypothetical protein